MPAAPPDHPNRRRRRTIAVVAAYLLALVAAMTAAESLRVAGDAAERAGLAAFYEQPANAADGAPGSIVKAEALEGVPLASRAWRIMYRTTDLDGAPIVATGIVVTPLSPIPGPRTVLAWGHPTTGTSADCAPSRSFDPFIGIEGLRMMLDRGYTVVATDYAGMGTAGPDSYLVGSTAAHAVLDAVRAAGAIDGAEASERMILWGHSQGGQAVLFAAEEAAEYAPELDVVAVAAAAPAADLTALMGSHLDDISGVTIGSYAFPAFASVYADSVPGVELGDILSPAAVELVPKMNELCLLTNLGRLHEMGEPLVGDFFLHDPTKTAPWDQLLEQNSAGRRAIDVPLFVAQGADDQLVLPADTADFVARERSLGVTVTEVTVPLATHSTIAYLALPELDAWLDRVDRASPGSGAQLRDAPHPTGPIRIATDRMGVYAKEAAMSDSVPAGLPAPVTRFVQAINDADTDAFVETFTEAGLVDDWGRVLSGPAGVRSWAQSDAIGADARMTVLQASVDGDVVTTRFSWRSRVFNGESTGIFVLDGDRLASFTIPPHH